MSDTEFYIGYKSSAPPRVARFLRRGVVSLLLGAVVLAVALAALQKPFDPGQFEFGVIRDFEGVLLENPVPTLLVAGTEEMAAEQTTHSRYLLVAPGKFGAADLVAGLDGRAIQTRGTLIHRGTQTMIELVPGSIRELESKSGPWVSTAIDLGEHTLVGEIVDSKCYLGVMKPGREKTHRACAVRCISGGIPPMLRTTTAEDEIIHLLLLGRDGLALNREILDFVAEPVAISGVIQRLGDLLVLLADPSSIRRLQG